MKLKDFKGLKTLKTYLCRFLGKILVCLNLGTKGPKMDFLITFSRNSIFIFLRYCAYEVRGLYRLKTDLARFFRKVLFAQIWSECPQNELFRLLLKIAQSSFVDIWGVVTGHETLRRKWPLFVFTKTC